MNHNSGYDLDVLVVAPHPDDAELGMGGTIVKLLHEGWQVGVLELTNGEPTPHGSPEIRAQETAAASAAMGLAWRQNLDLPNRELEATLDARRKLAEVVRVSRPRWLFAPYWEDAHPDHVAATKLVEDARFWAKLSKTDMQGEPFHPERIYNYFCVHLKLAPQPDFIVDISAHWPAKRTAMECYQSQFIMGRDPGPPSFIESLEMEAACWGRRIGVKYGEPFACREPIGLKSLDRLI